ncbi:hypothetical protein FB567DRAFT_452644 [Paraphoma chrysanthemicola]|uniref:Uncharacterized protein n=1 Tax=Paraphoma chrysanthemicola TaxID=798071 RepID=A0A8K0VUJ0_9PLEO|nr:hypothetical protein FB567DRAFT_452644 [Paraphoma chrysanthemicola]
MQRRPSIREAPQYPSDQRSVYTQSSDPNPPASPTYYRQPAPYAQGMAVVEPAQSRRRPSIVRPRPQSFAGDPRDLSWQGPTGYPSPPQERGPPIAFNNGGYQNMPPNMHYPAPIPPFIHPSQHGAFYPPGAPPSASFETRPPMMSHGSSNNYGSRRGPAPIVTQQVDPTKYSARFGPPTPVEPRMRAPGPRLLRDEAEEDYSESGSSDGEDAQAEAEAQAQYAYDEERRARRHARKEAERRALMPPPPPKRDPSQRRPTLPHANTTQNIYPSDRPSRNGRPQSAFIVTERPAQREREREREPQRPAPPVRRASVSRPPMHRQSQSEYDTRSTRVVVNNSKNRRPQSYQTERVYDDLAQARAVEDQYLAERKRERRASKIIQERRPMPGGFGDDDDEVEEEAQVLRPILRTRRQTDASDIRKGKERPVEKKADAAEEYIKSTRGSRDPFADQINKAAKRASRMPSVPSDSGSSQSNGSAPVNLQITGDMEGRTLQLVPAEGGATDLVIGNARGETSYHSERGSVMANNRRSIVAGQGRRDAEEASERSSRTGRSRRDHDEIRESRDDREGRRHVLRRSRNTTYH